MAQGATSAAHTPATPPAGSMGAYSPRSGSSFFDRFNRRPRTANSTHNRNVSSNSPAAGVPATFSTESLTGAGATRHQQQQPQPQYLPRSSSSSNIAQNLSFPRDSAASPPATPPAVNVHRNPMNGPVGAASPAQASSGAGGSGSAFGRMFRRYSHGAGKNSQDIAAAAAATAVNADGSRASNQGSNAGATGTSTSYSPSPASAAVASSPANGRPSALRSLSNHFLPSTSSLVSRIPDAITRTMSNQLIAASGGMATASAPRSSVDVYTASGRPSGQAGTGSSAGLPANTDVGQNTSANSGTPAHADTNSGGAGLPNQDSTSGQAGPSTTTASSGPNPAQGYRIRLVPHLEVSRSLHFEPIERELKDGAPSVKIGRFTERGGTSGPGAAPSAVGANLQSAREGLTTASGPGTGAGGGATLGAHARSAGIDVEMAGMGGGASASGFGAGAGAGAAESVPSVLASGRRQATGGRGGNNSLDSSRIAFKSKVVSRGHAEIWCENGGNFFLRDTKSSSGTFLNHIRLSAPGVESRPFRIKDGDVIQLGVDYQGGTEEIYRCVKMRIELNRGWQREANPYNVNALRQLRALQGSPMPGTPSGNETDKVLTGDAAPGATVSAVAQPPTSVTDCCICLFSVTVCQALFIAPCSHVFHYKCIRPLLTIHHPGFSCPLCRTFADLEADVEEEDEEWQADLMRQATQGVDRAGTTSSAPVASAPAVSAEPMSAQQTLAPGLAGSGTTSAAHPLATVQEVHSRQSSAIPSQAGDLLTRSGDSGMALDQAARGSSDANRSHDANRSQGGGGGAADGDDDDQEVLQDDDDDEMMEDFDDNAGDDDDDDDEGDEDDDDDGDLSSSSQPAGFAGTNNPAANLSLSASGSLAARRSLHNNGNFSPSPSPGSRYGDMSSVSEPIAMSIAAHAPIAGGSAAAGGAGAAGVAALEEARTPMNQHFLSTLAESSPGGPAFFSAAAARAAVSAAAAVARNGPGIIAAPNAEMNGNGHRSSHPASPLGLELADEELDVDRSTPSAGGGVGGAASPLAGPKRGAHDALGGRDSGRRSSSSGVGPAGNVDGEGGAAAAAAASSAALDEVMSD